MDITQLGGIPSALPDKNRSVLPSNEKQVKVTELKQIENEAVLDKEVAKARIEARRQKTKSQNQDTEFKIEKNALDAKIQEVPEYEYKPDPLNDIFTQVEQSKPKYPDEDRLRAVRQLEEAIIETRSDAVDEKVNRLTEINEQFERLAKNEEKVRSKEEDTSVPRLKTAEEESDQVREIALNKIQEFFQSSVQVESGIKSASAISKESFKNQDKKSIEEKVSALTQLTSFEPIEGTSFYKAVDLYEKESSGPAELKTDPAAVKVDLSLNHVELNKKAKKQSLKTKEASPQNQLSASSISQIQENAEHKTDLEDFQIKSKAPKLEKRLSQLNIKKSPELSPEQKKFEQVQDLKKEFSQLELELSDLANNIASEIPQPSDSPIYENSAPRLKKVSQEFKVKLQDFRSRVDNIRTRLPERESDHIPDKKEDFDLDPPTLDEALNLAKNFGTELEKNPEYTKINGVRPESVASLLS